MHLFFLTVELEEWKKRYYELEKQKNAPLAHWPPSIHVEHPRGELPSDELKRLQKKLEVMFRFLLYACIVLVVAYCHKSV